MILSISMILAIAAAMGISVAAAPEGTAIKSAADFAAMAADGKYYLANDITIEATYATEFTGTFDGNGKTVTVKAPMFAKVNNATIANFTVKGELDNTNGIEIDGYNFVAAVAVVANGTSAFKNIVCDANYTATHEKGRYGAIGATSEADHKLLFENCINNGNVTAILSGSNYAGGVYGWSAKLGQSAFKNCINNGKIEVAGYCAGIACRLSTKKDGSTLSFENCINNGDVTSTGSYAGGISGYSEAVLTITGCVNYGDIYGKSGSTGGIAGNCGDSTHLGVFTIKNNINYGNVTQDTEKKNCGGIVGYIHGSGEKHYGDVENNINYGTITGAGYTSQILGYTNSDFTTIKNNVGAGKVVGSDENRAVIVGLSSADITKYAISGNYQLENDGTKMYSYADSDSNEKNRVALANMPAGAINFVADVNTADVVNALNTAIGSTVYEIRDGKIALVCDHDAYLEIDGKCAACGYSEPVLPDNPVSGDNAWVYMTVAVFAVLGTAVVAKKREN